MTAALKAVRAVLGVLPTGAGKTVIFSSMMLDHPGASIAIEHRKEIVSQISCSLATFGIMHRIVAPPSTIAMIRRKHLAKFGRSFVDPNALRGVASVQSLTSKSSAKNYALQKWLDQCTFAVYDEGHHYVDEGQWAIAVHRLEHAMQLFITATPERADGIGLGAGSGPLGAGAEEASWNLNLVSNTPPPDEFVGVTNSDLGFTGDYAIQGNYNGYVCVVCGMWVR